MNISIPDEILKLYCARFELLDMSEEETANHAMQIDEVNDLIASKVDDWLNISKMDLSLYEQPEIA